MPTCQRVSEVIALLAFIGALPAYSQTAHYAIEFTSTSTGAPTATGSFDYDNTTSLFSNFTVVWDSITYDLTDDANAPSTTTPLFCTGGYTGAAASFYFLTQCSTAFAMAGPTMRKEIETGSYFTFVAYNSSLGEDSYNITAQSKDPRIDRKTPAGIEYTFTVALTDP
jgi:hypothetical protein